MTGSQPRTAVVTGGSRGVGAALVGLLAAAGWSTTFTYRDKRVRAERVVRAAESAGGLARAVPCDLTVADDRVRLGADVASGPGLDLLVLCASGGMETGRDPEYPLRLNRDAQVDLVTELAPAMRPGGRIVFVTSHQAHFVREVEVEPDYAPVAESKRAGEDALVALIPWLDSLGLDLVIVSADLLEDSTTTALFERLHPGSTAQRRAEIGTLPTTAAFAAAILAAAEGVRRSGQVDLYGGARWYERVEVGS